MFNNVWFYMFIYMAIGTVAILINGMVYKRVHNKVYNIGWAASVQFTNEALIHSGSTKMTYCIIALAYVLWPIFLVIAIVKRTMAYRKIMKEETEKEKWNEQFEEIQKKWLAR